ncbi:hypothetical protein C8R34_1821, partial [Nitrosomonas sp. Nm84]
NLSGVGKNNLMNLLMNYGKSSDIINSASLEPNLLFC